LRPARPIHYSIHATIPYYRSPTLTWKVKEKTEREKKKKKKALMNHATDPSVPPNPKEEKREKKKREDPEIHRLCPTENSSSSLKIPAW